MFEPSTVDEVQTQLEISIGFLSSTHQEIVKCALVAPFKISVDDSPGEYVIAVAMFGNLVLYWSDVEGGWEFSDLGEDRSIPKRGCNQFELSHVLNQLMEAENSAQPSIAANIYQPADGCDELNLRTTGDRNGKTCIDSDRPHR